VILLDTNVVSEPWRPQPNPAVLRWLDAQDENALYICTPVLAELRFGAARLPSSTRKQRLDNHINLLETTGFRGRVLDFDAAAALAFGTVGAHKEKIGRRMEPLDAMIAAIAFARGLKLATRDEFDFSDLGIELINPFKAAPVR
jgi:predicted nucleic acid-binding protein